MLILRIAKESLIYEGQDYRRSSERLSDADLPLYERASDLQRTGLLQICRTPFDADSLLCGTVLSIIGLSQLFRRAFQC